MVTRTIRTTEIKYKALYKQKGEVKEETFKTARYFTRPDDARRYVQNELQNPDVEVYAITELKHEQQTYGCTEEAFLSVAKPITPRRNYNKGDAEKTTDKGE